MRKPTKEELMDIGEEAWEECDTVAPVHCQYEPFMEVYEIAVNKILDKIKK